MIAASVDECLAEIAKDNPEVLDYFDSAYTRLLLVWAGALLTCVKKRGSSINAPEPRHRMGPQSNQRQNALRPRGGGVEAMRKKYEHSPPSVPNVRSV